MRNFNDSLVLKCHIFNLDLTILASPVSEKPKRYSLSFSLCNRKILVLIFFVQLSHFFALISELSFSRALYFKGIAKKFEKT